MAENKAIDLGFAEDCDSWLLSNKFFPSKVGGLVSWLELQNIPENNELLCEYCDEPCIFLCQVYAPSEINTSAFHRTIYMFICKNGKCCSENKTGNIKVFRSQLGRKNNFYSSDAPDDTFESDPVASPVKLCNLCGCRGPLLCGKCKEVGYCGAIHQKIDWKNGHKEQCGQPENVLEPPEEDPILFPEYEIVIEREKLEITMKKESEKDAEKRRVREYEEMIKAGKAGAMNEISDADMGEFTESKEDKTFGKFKNIIESNPEQILRYNRNGSPLWISSENTLNNNNILNCRNCNGKRSFEFQIMPQMLNLLKNYDLDWGVIAVYTCKNDCDVNSKYTVEFAYKQDITNGDDEGKGIDMEKLQLNASNECSTSEPKETIDVKVQSKKKNEKKDVAGPSKPVQKTFDDNDEWE